MSPFFYFLYIIDTLKQYNNLNQRNNKSEE